MKLTCFTFLSCREHLNLPSRGILINFTIQAKFIWILEVQYLNWIEFNGKEKSQCALWAESGRPIAQIGPTSNRRTREALGHGTRSRSGSSQPDTRLGAVRDGGGKVLGHAGGSWNLIWSPMEEESPVVRWLGGGEKMVASQRGGR
jgi:hypothetical protein